MTVEEHINLGTEQYQNKRYADALGNYQAALAINQNHALAHFNTANALDELGRWEETEEHYKRAIVLGYAVANYNLALFYMRRGNNGKSLQHWRAYTKFDPSSEWSVHARGESKRVVHMSGITLAHSNPSPNRSAYRAALQVVGD